MPTTICAQLSQKGCRRDDDGILRCEVQVGATLFEMTYDPSGSPSFQRTRGVRVAFSAYRDAFALAQWHIDSFLYKEEKKEIVSQAVVPLDQFRHFARRNGTVPPHLRGLGCRSGESRDE